MHQYVVSAFSLTPNVPRHFIILALDLVVLKISIGARGQVRQTLDQNVVGKFHESASFKNVAQEILRENQTQRPHRVRWIKTKMLQVMSGTMAPR